MRGGACGGRCPSGHSPRRTACHAVRALPPRRHRRSGSGTCVHTPCTSIKSWDGGGAPTDARGCLCSLPCEQHQRAGSTAHMRRGGTAARASGATLSTYITICVYRLLRKHDRLARNTADLSESLIKQKKPNNKAPKTQKPNKTPNPASGPSWSGLFGSCNVGRFALPSLSSAGGVPALPNSLEGSSWPRANVGVCSAAGSRFF